MKNIIYFAIGVAAGSAVTFLSVRGYYRKIAFDEISEVRKAYKKMSAAKEMAAKNEEEKEKMRSEMTKSGKTGNENENYNILIDRYSGKNRNDDDENNDDEDDDPYEFVVDHTSPSEGYSESPFLISEEEFASEKLFYDKVMVEYYINGVAVLEETDELIESIEDLIGPNILNESFEEDTIYVRNDNRSTDYGIIFKDTSFGPEEGLL